MNIGNLDKRIIIQKPDTVPDGQGGDKIIGWLDFKEVWAWIKKPRTQTQAAEGDIVSVMTREIEIRNLPGVKIGWRILYKTDTYKVIHAYSLDEIKTIMICVEVAR